MLVKSINIIDKKVSNKLQVGEFSNKAPILRNTAQQDEPGVK
jgi:hypothetical protein